MADEIDDLIAPLENNSPAQSVDDIDNLIAPSTMTGGQVPRRNKYGSDVSELNRVWSNRSSMDRARIAGGHFASNIPIVGPMISSTPQGELEEFETARPVASFASRTGARALPYTAMGAGIPALMSTVPRAALAGGAIEGADAAVRGENIPTGAGLGALFGATGTGLSKMISPRGGIPNPQLTARQAAAEQARNEAINRHVPYRDPQTNLFAPDPRPIAERFAERHAQGTQAAQEAARRLAEEQRTSRSLPEFTRLPAWARMGITGVPTWAMTMGHPVATGAAALAGLAAPAIRRAGNRVLQSERTDKYLNNQLMNPRRRSMLAALLESVNPGPEGINNTSVEQMLTDYMPAR